MPYLYHVFFFHFSPFKSRRGILTCQVIITVSRKGSFAVSLPGHTLDHKRRREFHPCSTAVAVHKPNSYTSFDVFSVHDGSAAVKGVKGYSSTRRTSMS